MTDDPALLIDSRHCAAGGLLAEALRSIGAAVSLTGNDGFADRAAAQARFAACPRPDAVIVLAMPEPAARAATCLVDLDDANWLEVTDQALRAALYAFQAARTVFAGGGGSILCVGPSVGLSGAAQLTALATLAEGQRALVKATARQWGAQNIRVNFVSMATSVLLPDLADVLLPETPELGVVGPALGRRPGIADLAALALYLAGPGSAQTGASFSLDGGEWMLP